MENWRVPYAGNLSSDDNYVCISEYNSKSGHNGVIQDTYLTTCLDIDTGNEIWSVDEGRAVSVFDGMAYITTLKRQFFSDQQARGYTSCYELSSGKELWSTDSAFGYSISVESGRVYLTHDYDYHYTKAFCLDAVTGRVIWNVSFKKADPFLWKRTREFSLVSYNDYLAVLDDDSLFLIDSATGKLKWKNDIERIPIFGEDGKVYVATEDGLFCIDGENGNVIWHNTRLCSRLALEGNLLAATGPDGTYCIDTERFFLE
ncbi:Outer membrane protein assembly factor BamB [subsurface metagenome]